MNAETLYLYLAGLACVARIEAMKAENMQRAAVGNSMAYDDAPFFAEAAELDRLAVAAANLPQEPR